jgi:hypothetical protein
LDTDLLHMVLVVKISTSSLLEELVLDSSPMRSINLQTVHWVFCCFAFLGFEKSSPTCWLWDVRCFFQCPQLTPSSRFVRAPVFGTVNNLPSCPHTSFYLFLTQLIYRGCYIFPIGFNKILRKSAVFVLFFFLLEQYHLF